MAIPLPSDGGIGLLSLPTRSAKAIVTRRNVALKANPNDLNEDEIEVIVAEKKKKLSYKFRPLEPLHNGHAGNLLVQSLLKAFLAWRAWAVIAPYKLGIGIALLATVITQTAHSEFIEYLQVQASVRTNASSLDNVEKALQLAYLAKWSSFSLIALLLLLYVWRVGSQSRAVMIELLTSRRGLLQGRQVHQETSRLEQPKNDQLHSPTNPRVKLVR